MLRIIIKPMRYVLGSCIELAGIIILLIAILLTYVRDIVNFGIKKIEGAADAINRAAHIIAGEHKS